MTDTATIHEEIIDGVVIFKIGGRLDAVTAQPVEKRVLQALHGSEHRVIMDCTRVTYLSSAGMRMLLSVFKQVKAASGQLGLCSVEDSVLDILKIAGFDEIVDVFSSLEEALQKIHSTLEAH